jgi:hypothetical protein
VPLQLLAVGVDDPAALTVGAAVPDRVPPAAVADAPALILEPTDDEGEFDGDADAVNVAVAAADGVAAGEAVAAPEGVRAADCAAGALPLTVLVEHGEGETLALPLPLGGAVAEAEAEALPP